MECILDTISTVRASNFVTTALHPTGGTVSMLVDLDYASAQMDEGCGPYIPGYFHWDGYSIRGKWRSGTDVCVNSRWVGWGRKGSLSQGLELKDERRLDSMEEERWNYVRLYFELEEESIFTKVPFLVKFMVFLSNIIWSVDDKRSGMPTDLQERINRYLLR